MRTVFTTGMVAKICQVAPRTVSKWFDSGRLKGYRIPGSKDRRIPRANLIQFLKEHGMPLGELENDIGKTLLISPDASLEFALNKAMREIGLSIEVAASGFEAGGKMHEVNCVVIDYAIGHKQVDAIVTALQGNPECLDITIIALYQAEDHEQANRENFSESFRKPFDIYLLAERIRSLLQARK